MANVLHFRDVVGYTLLIMLSGMCAFVLAPAGARAQSENSSYDMADKRSSMVFSVTKDPFTLTQGMLAYDVGGQYFFPVRKMAEMLDFAVELELTEKRVTGWALKKNNSYIIDAARRQIVHQGAKEAVSEPAFIVDDTGGFGDIYVRRDLLNKIWPVTFDVDLSTLSVNVSTKEPLPFERALEREKRREKLQNKGRKVTKAELPTYPNPYRLISWPALDFETRIDMRDSELTASSSISGVQDFLGMSANYTANFSSTPDERLDMPNNPQVRLQRVKPDSEPPMPLGLRRIRLGDVRTNHPDLVGNGVSGRGVVISNTKRGNSDQIFDTITVEGTGPPGWEVELFRNESFINVGTVDEDGEYRFEDVALNTGNNRIRVVLYGPQGQVRERVENHRVDGSMVRPGQWRFKASAVDGNEDLIQLVEERRNTNFSEPKGIAANFRGFYGLNNNLTLFASGTTLPMRGQGGPGQNITKSYVSIGSTQAIGNIISRIEIINELEGGKALDLRFLTDVAGISVNMKAAKFIDFESPEADFGRRAKTFESNIQLAGNVPTIAGKLGLRLQAEHTRRQDDFRTTDLLLRESLGISGLRLSHDNTVDLVDGNLENIQGRARLTTRHSNWRVRGGLQYQSEPIWQINSINGSLRYSFDDDGSMSFNANHDLRNNTTSAGFQVSRLFDNFLVSFNTSVTDRDGGSLDMTLRLSTSIAPYGRNNSYNISGRDNTKRAPITGHVFLDRNQDGKFTQDTDRALKNTGLKIDGRAVKKQTQLEDGRVRVMVSQTDKVKRVRLNQDRLEDPFLRPAKEGYEVTPRPGTRPVLPFPVVETGRVSGTVKTAEDREPVSGMTLQLVNESGEVQKAAQTAYDGYYTFEFVRPGSYTLRAKPSYNVDVTEKEIELNHKKLFASDVILILNDNKQSRKNEKEADSDEQ